MGNTLEDLQLATVEIPTPGGSFSVRGLALADIVTISQNFGPQAAMLFSKIVNKEKILETDIRTIIMDLLPQAPDMLAMAIALSADAPKMAPKVMKLQPQYQLAALEAIFQLTFESEAELKKFMESIIRMLVGATGLVEQMRLPLSEAGFGDLDAK
jgi:hypothetical protein